MLMDVLLRAFLQEVTAVEVWARLGAALAMAAVVYGAVVWRVRREMAR